MKELFEYTFSGINLIPTILLIFVLIYWLIVLIGLIDMNSIDVDVDTDADLDMDTDIDVDTDVHVDTHVEVDTHLHVETDVHADMDTDLDTHIDAHTEAGGNIHGSPGAFLQMLVYFNLGKLPFMLLLSFVAIPLWIITLYTNYYLNINQIWLALLLLIPELFVSLFIAKFLSTPIARMFSKIDEETGRPVDFQGKTATVRIAADADSFGQIEVKHKDSTVLLTAKTTGMPVTAGEKVLIIDYIKEEKYYLIEIITS